MNDWIIVALAVSQIVVLFWLSTRSCLALINKIYLDKNVAWVRDNPAFYKRFSQPKYAKFMMYLIGAFWLFGLSSMLDERSDTKLFFYTIMPNFVWQLVLAVYVVAMYFLIAKKIPLAAKRSTNLARRNLRDYVHPLWTALCVGCYLFVFGAYVVALSNQQIETNTFLYRVIYVCFVLLITTVLLRYSVRRKKHFLDDVFGSSFRRWEVIANFVFSMLGGALVVLWVMINDLTASLWATQINIAVALSVVTQILLIYLTFNARIKLAIGYAAPVEMKM